MPYQDPKFGGEGKIPVMGVVHQPGGDPGDSEPDIRFGGYDYDTSLPDTGDYSDDNIIGDIVEGVLDFLSGLFG